MQNNQSVQSRLFSSHSTSRRQLSLLLLGTGLLLAAPRVQAAVKTWDGSSSGYWGSSANWTGGVAPVNGDDLVFPSGAANLVNTNNYTSLKVNSVTFTGFGYTLRGNALTVTNGISGQQAAGANTLECIVTLGAAQTFDCTTAGASQFLMGNLSNGGFLLTVSGRGSVALGGRISGTGGVTKSGTGTLTYSGAADNLYTGPTRVTAGLLQLAKSARWRSPARPCGSWLMSRLAPCRSPSTRAACWTWMVFRTPSAPA
jgi:autotransporter-associated beta strand protein